MLQYGYDASGVKRIEEEYTAIAGLTVPMEEFTQVSLLNYSRRDYCGNVVYGGNGGGYVSYLYTPEGYARRANIVSGDWVYYYTLKDHLGSVRSEFKGDGTNVGYTHYYPSGIEITDPGNSQSLQSQERYNGKEFQSMFGLNTNDYGARFLDGPRGGQWWTPDLLAEKYYSWSPYCYALCNPIKYIDPDGLGVYYDEMTGRAIHTDEEEDDLVYVGSATVKWDKNTKSTFTIVGKRKDIPDKTRIFSRSLKTT